MVEVKFGPEEINELITQPIGQVIGGISLYMDKINIDESMMEIVTDKFTFTLSAKRNNGSQVVSVWL